MKKKVIVAVACAIIFAAIPCSTSYAGQWKSDENGFWYENDKGSYIKNGWLEYEGKWYHFDNDGYMQKNEWIMDSGKWYYLDADGVCLVNTTTPDNYTVGSDGAYTFQMPATGIPSLESMKLISTEEQYTFVSELYSGMYSYKGDNLWDLEDYADMIPNNMNVIIADAEYYGALCEHVLKKFKNATLAESMVSNNPAIRVYAHCMEEYRQIYIKYLPLLSKNLKNSQFATYLDNLSKLEKEISQLEERYSPYLNEISGWYYSAFYQDYYDYYY